ncbi:uncharacterized protein LOC143047380 [Mytilus galloprovincialis]|uniref:uncharacterized protein LOC143047380 n=1 Tax=Mytilus galloprovincialis TaxID=29158 RepID=UPI003F7C4D1F
MNTTVNIQLAPKVNHAVTVLFTALAGLTVLVDISYIIVCSKALKKTYHHLMILGLFFSDSILGISSALFSLSSIIQHKFIGSCLVQIFLFSFGIQLNYCLIFLLCLQRYFVVSSFNFGKNDRFNRNKFIHIGVAIFLSFIFALFGSILTPKAEYMQVCTGPVVFGDSFYIFVTVIFLPITVIIIVLLIMSIITSFRLWKIYFKGTIAPKQRVREDIIMSDCMQSSKTNQCSHISNSNASEIKEQNEDKENIDLKHYSNRNPLTTSTDNSSSFDASRQLKKSWEIRAFLTTIIIAFQTIILTGPFVASFWIEVFSNAPLALQIKLLLFIPNLINSISNPFIYAWRIPEIRQEFKKLFRINN